MLCYTKIMVPFYVKLLFMMFLFVVVVSINMLV